MAIGYKVTVDLRGSYKNKYYNSLSEIKRKAYLTDTFAAWTFPNRKTKYFIYDRYNRLVVQVEEYEKKPRATKQMHKRCDFANRRWALEGLIKGNSKLIINDDEDYYWAKLALEQWALRYTELKPLLKELNYAEGDYPLEVYKKGYREYKIIKSSKLL